MAKRGIPKLEAKSVVSGWAFVLLAGLLLAAVAILDQRRDSTAPRAPAADGSTGCQLEVTTEQLNVRAGPSQDSELLRDAEPRRRVDGTRIAGRPLPPAGGRRWAVNEFLTPVPGTDCS